jgi:hypothetical protein
MAYPCPNAQALDMKKARREPGLPLEFVLIVDASTSVVIEKRMSALLRGLKLLGSHLARLVVADHFEAELLALDEFAHSSALDGGDVDESVLAAVIGLDEAEAFGGIEPFHCAGGHE